MRIGRTQSPGHPDHACDVIAETVVDEYLRRDPTSSLRVHVTGGRGALFVTGVVSSKADFDVGAVVQRTAAGLGARKPVEPFVAIEPATGSVLLDVLRSSRPISVTGYAVRETDALIPRTVDLSRRIAKTLEGKRTQDPEWYWLEPSFEVTVAESARGSLDVTVTCAHGDQDVSDVRTRIAAVTSGMLGDARVRVNPSGPLPAFGLDDDIGASGLAQDPYGSGLPSAPPFIGLDPSHPGKFGTWLARGLARTKLASADAQAVLVQAVYEPGKPEPVSLRIRDERGRDLSRPDDAAAMSYAVLARQFRHGLNAEACRWGFAGEAGLPWEEISN